jgi:hypothetical protein
MIDPSFWESETMASLAFFERLVFIGLFSQADDQGRLKAHPALLSSKLFPFDGLPASEISDALTSLAAAESVLVYAVDGKEYVQLLNWWKYQKPRWAWPSDIPAPNGWEDQLHYRQGNNHVFCNWPDVDDTPTPESEPVEPAPAPKSADDKPVAAPERPQSGPTMGKEIPTSSTRNSIRDSGSGSGRTSSLAAEAAPATPAQNGDYQEMRQTWIALFPAKPKPRADNRTLQQKLKTRMKSAHFQEHWQLALERASSSRFLADSSWFDLGWFLRNDDHYEKCLNGNYDDKSAQGNARASPGNVPEPKGFAAIRAVMEREGWPDEEVGI